MVQYKLVLLTLSKKLNFLTKRSTSNARYAIVGTLKVCIDKPKLTRHLKFLQWIVHALGSRKMLL